MAELTRETFIEIQTRLAQEATDRENRRIQEINESNSRLAKNLVDLGTKLEKATKDGDQETIDFLKDQITATERQQKDNQDRLKGEKDFRTATVKSFDAREKALNELGKQAEARGLKREQDADFRREQLQLQIDKLDEQAKGDLTPSQMEENRKERAALARKQETVLNALRNGVDGLAEGFKKLGDIQTGIPGITLGKLALLAVIPLLIKFLDSVAFKKLFVFLKDPSLTTFFDFLGELGPVFGTIAAIIGGIALAKIVTAARGLALAMGGFLKGVGKIRDSVRNVTRSMKTSPILDKQGRTLTQGKDGKMRVAAGQQGGGQIVSEKNVQKQPSKLGKVVKGTAKLAKFIPGFGLAVTGIFGLFDGITAGLEQAKKEGATRLGVFKAGVAGAISGLTFGFISQEGISNAMSKVGDGFKNALNKSSELASKGFENLKSGFNSAFEKAKEAFTPSEEFKNRLSELNPFKNFSFDKVRESLSELNLDGFREKLQNFKPFEGLREKLKDFKLPELPKFNLTFPKLTFPKIGNPFSGVIDKIKTSTLLEGALPEGERSFNPFKLKIVGSLKGFLKDSLLDVFPDKVETVSPSNVAGARQTGGLVPKGKLALIGEQGPELVMTRSPTQVFSESRTDQLGMAALNKLMSGGGMGGGGQIVIAPNQVQNNTTQNIVRPLSIQDPIIDKMTSSLAI